MWLKAGDKNNRYFHTSAVTRRRNNHIHKLQNSSGVWLDWNEGLADLISNYFQGIFTASGAVWETVIDNVPTSITEEQNADLLKEVTVDEVKNALF